jgi:ferredoxin
MGSLTYIRGVTTIRLDEKACNGCEMCLDVCPHPVFVRHDGRVQVGAPDACMECGACVVNCPEDALSVNPGTGCVIAILKGWIRGSDPSCC